MVREVAVTAGTVSILLHGAMFTVQLAAVAVVLGTLIGIGLTVLSFSRLFVARSAYNAYVWVIRGTPLLVQAMLLFYAAGSYFRGMGPYTAGAIILSIYVGALYVEVIRGGVLAIPKSLWDASKSLGMPKWRTTTKVVVPLVLRYTLPAYVNTCVMAVKATSILSIIGVWELTFASRQIIERTLDTFSVLSMAAVMYFVICFTLDRLSRRLEARLAKRGFVGERS